MEDGVVYSCFSARINRRLAAIRLTARERITVPRR